MNTKLMSKGYKRGTKEAQKGHNMYRKGTPKGHNRNTTGTRTDIMVDTRVTIRGTKEHKRTRTEA